MNGLGPAEFGAGGLCAEVRTEFRESSNVENIHSNKHRPSCAWYHQVYIYRISSQDERSVVWHKSCPCKYLPGHLRSNYSLLIFLKLNHVHLVSTFRYPTLTAVGINKIAENLLQAPRITKEISSVNWRFLDCPPDGTVILAWQPLAQLGTRFATDGYVWADAEQFVSQQYQGYVRCPWID